mmetsp:Transcript_3471/g.9190  ORF Transcript_3471/g.9190 Transcript_3471/m.9190 type:complete len:381 (+) Transcript_3471:1634-2776(+)
MVASDHDEGLLGHRRYQLVVRQCVTRERRRGGLQLTRLPHSGDPLARLVPVHRQRRPTAAAAVVVVVVAVVIAVVVVHYVAGVRLVRIRADGQQPVPVAQVGRSSPGDGSRGELRKALAQDEGVPGRQDGVASLVVVVVVVVNVVVVEVVPGQPVLEQIVDGVQSPAADLEGPRQRRRLRHQFREGPGDVPVLDVPTAIVVVRSSSDDVVAAETLQEVVDVVFQTGFGVIDQYVRYRRLRGPCVDLLRDEGRGPVGIQSFPGGIRPVVVVVVPILLVVDGDDLDVRPLHGIGVCRCLVFGVVRRRRRGYATAALFSVALRCARCRVAGAGGEDANDNRSGKQSKLSKKPFDRIGDDVPFVESKELSENQARSISVLIASR